MNVIDYEVDLSNKWTNKVLEKLSDSLIDEPRIKTIYRKSGYILIDVWASTESKKTRSGAYYPHFEFTLDVLSDDEDDYKAEWVLSDEDEKEIGRFESNTDIVYKEDEDEYVYSVHEDIDKLTEQIIDAFDKYIEKAEIEEQKEELVDMADKLIEYYNDNDIFEYKDGIEIVKYIMKKMDISVENLEEN